MKGVMESTPTPTPSSPTSPLRQIKNNRMLFTPLERQKRVVRKIQMYMYQRLLCSGGGGALP